MYFLMAFKWLSILSLKFQTAYINKQHRYCRENVLTISFSRVSMPTYVLMTHKIRYKMHGLSDVLKRLFGCCQQYRQYKNWFN